MPIAVSVIMPWRDTTVRETIRSLRSVLSQEVPTGTTVEVVVCDDSDNSTSRRGLQNVVMALDPAHRVIRVVRSQGGAGIARARNAACLAADGNWLLWLDADDELGIGALSGLTSTAQETAAAIIAPQCLVISPETTQIHYNDVYLELARAHAATIDDPLSQVVFPVHGQLVARDVFVATGGFDVSYRYGELTEWFLRAVSAATISSVASTRDAHYHYHRTPFSHSTNRTQLEAFRARALLVQASRSNLGVDGIRYIARHPQTGAQHYALERAGRALTTIPSLMLEARELVT